MMDSSKNEEQINITESMLKNKIAAISHDSNTFQKLGLYVENNWSCIMLMTATEVAKNAKVSQGSVSRFCTSLGYSGFSQFTKLLKQLARGELTGPNRLKNIKNSQKGSSQSDIRNIVESARENLNKVYDIVQQPEFETLIDRLVKSKKIILMAARISATLLDGIYYSLSKIRDNVEIAKPGTREWNLLELNNTEDTFVLVISFPRYARELVEKCEYANRRGFQLGLITDSIISPIAKYAQFHIELPLSIPSIFDLYGTPNVFFNIVVMEVAKRLDGLEERMSRIEEFEQEQDVYYKISERR